VIISHNHYDHLDLITIQSLLAKFPLAKYFVPLGNKSWFTSQDIAPENVIELDWWDKREFSPEDFGKSARKKRSGEVLLRFTCVPAQHNSGRGALDQGTTLWSGWVIEQFLVSSDEASPSLIRRKGAIYHAGDTGYRRTAKSEAVCPVFKEIGLKFGGFDLSFVPIWRGGTLSWISKLGLRLDHNDIPAALHASPLDAVDIHRDVGSRVSVAVHFGTFVGSENERLEAVLEFEEGREERGVGALDGSGGESGKGRAGIVDIGGSVVVEVKEEEADS